MASIEDKFEYWKEEVKRILESEETLKGRPPKEDLLAIFIKWSLLKESIKIFFLLVFIKVDYDYEISIVFFFREWGVTVLDFGLGV